MVPEELGVMLTKQLDAVALTVDNVQGDPLTVAVAVPTFVNETVPPGADAVPAPVSLTKAVHVTVWPTKTVDGEHVTLVVVALVPPTLTVLLDPVLAE